ncbi:MAG: hypothetical protein JSW10_08270 [Pseudomonadota bacterium]|nr:MAG: hypothetical protein JSW10_08270 [Pseudomonadota bacterium]
MAVYYDIQRDNESGRWFFVIFGEQGEDVYESEPGFDSDQQAEGAALRWIADNLIGGDEDRR